MGVATSIEAQLATLRGVAKQASPYWSARLNMAIGNVERAVRDPGVPQHGASAAALGAFGPIGQAAVALVDLRGGCPAWSSPSAGVERRAQFDALCGNWSARLRSTLYDLRSTLKEYDVGTGRTSGYVEVLGSLLDELGTTVEQAGGGPPAERRPWWRVTWDALPPVGKGALTIGVALVGVSLVSNVAGLLLPVVQLGRALAAKRDS